MTKNYAWFAVILSTILFTSAFFIPSLGWMIIPAHLLFSWVLVSIPSASVVRISFAWATCSFGAHFLWVFFLLQNRPHAGTIGASLGYLLIVFYFVTVFTFLQYASKKVITYVSSVFSLKMFTHLLLWAGYYLLITHYGLTPLLGIKEGYPFLNPCIPLAPYLTQQTIPQELFNYPIVHLTPPTTEHPSADGQVIFHELAIYKKKSYLLLAPESFFAFPLTHYQEHLPLWRAALHEQSIMIFGAQELVDGKLYQAIYQLTHKQISCLHRKKHLISFVEHMPPWWKEIFFLKRIFLDKVQEFSCYNGENKSFEIQEKQVSTQLCSELFFTAKKKNHLDRLMFFLVNDRWFVDYFKKIMENLASLKSVTLNIPILYVGHSSYKQFSRKE